MGLLLTATTATGCIIPQDDYVLQPLPPRKNRPPRIIPETISGPAEVGTDPNCGDYTFEAAVEDPDVDDIIRWAFFIDYEKGFTQKFRDGFIIPSNLVQRPTKARATFNAGTGSTPLFSGTEPHKVELWIADTDFGNDRVAGPHGETADGGSDPGYTDTYTWFVEPVPGSCP